LGGACRCAKLRGPRVARAAFRVSLEKTMSRILACAAIFAVAFACRGIGAAEVADVAVAPPDNPSAEQFINPDRSYPSSCLQAPLGLGLWQNDPNHVQKSVELIGDANSTDSAERSFKETVTINVFRVPCTSGLSATLIEIDRPCGSACSSATYPTMPRVVAFNRILRVAQDPNTFFSGVRERAPLYTSGVFVLENVYGAHNAGNFYDYGQAFTLTVNNLQSASNLTDFAMPAYNAAQYPDAALAMRINGYMSTNWANDKQDKDGIIVQVYDGFDFATRIFAFAWFTYDNNHRPFWLFGQGSLPIGARTVTVPVSYFLGGTFVPPTSTATTTKTWGTATFTFPDCAHMAVQYTGDASADQGPTGTTGTGTSTLTFTRTGYVNGLTCI
jgi:hypothetical protein